MLGAVLQPLTKFVPMKQFISGEWHTVVLVLLGVLLAAPAWAQREYFNWYFGDSAGVSFVAPVPQPTPLLNGKVQFSLGTASMSDAAGRFAFATDGLTIWDRNWRPMPGRNVAQRLRGYGENKRHVLALPQPGSSSRYYVFVSQREFYADEYPVSGSNAQYLPYAVVDMNARNGAGGIVAWDSLQLPRWQLHVQIPWYGLIGNWAAVRHANGMDMWLVGLTTEGQYVSWLLTAAGLSPTPVLSLSPRLIGSGGILKAAPNGRQLACLFTASNGQLRQTYGRLEVAGFDPATGQVNGALELKTRFKGQGSQALPLLQGLEFSPDGARLYVDSAGLHPLQYDLLAGSAAAIDASRTAIQSATSATAPGRLMDLKLGPDGKIYIAYNGGFMGCINAPNVLGNACQLRVDQVRLQPRRHNFGTLPLAPNDLNLPPVVVSGAGSIATLDGSMCLGEPLAFLSSLSPFVTAAAYAWDFGDPASGPLNTSAGQSPVHRYAQAGTYTVTLRVAASDGQQFTTTASITVTDCTDIPNIITPNGDGRNDAFVLRGLRAADWRCRIFNRWGRLIFEVDSYQNNWSAAGQPDGTYFYQLVHRQTGKAIKGTVEVLR